MGIPTTQDMFLFQQLDLFYDFGTRHELPAHIEQNSQHTEGSGAMFLGAGSFTMLLDGDFKVFLLLC